ncbi:hypothetical protein EC973_002717 [Apophysomyces ossiformis]|uniref:non-specific serine/threonine protein kinase n=1 Tax=Apophysomyces ossiformis TaxID=679940 RepID=A0A8H7BM94_9FUNG|nr:hypothetical protein EC973_002717 [Apophysomyces ossiformis]
MDLLELRKTTMHRSIDFMRHTEKDWTMPKNFPSASLSLDIRSKTKSVGSPVNRIQKDLSMLQLGKHRRRTSNPLPDIREQDSSRRSSSNSSSSSSTSPSSATSSSADDDVHPLFSHFSQSTLHNPTRFLPQNQAILTTYEDWRIILTNDIAAFVLVGNGGGCNHGLVGKSVLDFIAPSFHERLKEMIAKRRSELNHLEDNAGGMVLVCGNVLPIIKQDGFRSAASLWLKEKRNDAGSSVYIWIFEEVFESLIHVSVNNEGTISYVDEGIHELYGYKVEDLLNKSVSVLLPTLERIDGKYVWQDINRLRFFGSRTKLGANFPIVAKMHDVSAIGSTPCFTIRITSIPMIAGLVTVRRDGIIEGCNEVFVEYMFGFTQDELVKGSRHIGDLLPQFPIILSNLQRDDLLQSGIIINNVICRKLLAGSSTSMDEYTKGKRLTQAPNGQNLPVLIALHRDGTPFEIQLQLKLVEGSDDVCALWITFDREQTFGRFGHVKNVSAGSAEVKPSPQEGSEALAPKFVAKAPTQRFVYHGVENTNQTPASVTRASHDTAVPGSSPDTQPQTNSATPAALDPPLYSAQTKKVSIKDYAILENLGQGAYGLVKLAVRIDDPEKKKVVIKYVIKSRILVDCWTRDRKLGMLPVEIHILHTLRKIPHVNCGDMLDYFEDDDYYYIVMELHGAGMDLFDYIELKNGMVESEIRMIFKQVALAVRHLHSHKIVHRDIKDENVVLDHNGGARLIDFGSAAYLKPGRRYDTFVGTLDYAAPEILRGQTYQGPPQDVWALGILLYTLIYRETPFYSVDEILDGELRVPSVPVPGSQRRAFHVSCLSFAEKQATNTEQIAQKLNLTFRTEGIFQRALTHKSFKHGKVPTNERLEEIGQRALAQMLTDAAVESHGTNVEADVLKTFVQQRMASETLQSRFDALGLHEGCQYDLPPGKVGPVVKAKAVKAVVGAVYHDQGWNATKEFVKKHLL